MATAKHGFTCIIFARRPRSGRVKRRLARHIGGHKAARIYADLLASSVHEVEQLRGCRRVLMPAAAAHSHWFTGRFRARRWCIKAQRPGTLGQRMAHAFERETERSQAVLLIGSDIADFTAADLAQAVQRLSECDIVLGPAADGGYWLIGMSRPQPRLFDAISWGSHRVLQQTLDVAKAQGLRSALVAERNDVDRVGDLSYLKSWPVQRKRARSRSRRAT